MYVCINSDVPAVLQRLRACLLFGYGGNQRLKGASKKGYEEGAKRTKPLCC